MRIPMMIDTKKSKPSEITARLFLCPEPCASHPSGKVSSAREAGVFLF